MTIDIFSLIFGALMWEFIRGYFTGFVFPSMKQKRACKQKHKENNIKNDKKPKETKEAES